MKIFFTNLIMLLLPTWIYASPISSTSSEKVSQDVSLELEDGGLERIIKDNDK